MRCALLLALAACCWTLLFASAHPVWGDSVFDLEAARGLLRDGSLSVAEPLRDDLIRGPGGRYYVKYPLLQTLLVVPAIAIFDSLLQAGPSPVNWQFMAMSLPAAGVAGLGLAGLFCCLRRLDVPLRGAAIASSLAFVCSPWWVYARYYYGENLQICLAAWLLWAWLGTREARANGLLLGFLGGMLLNCKATYAVWLVILLGDLIYTGQKHRDLARRLGTTFLGGLPGLFLLLGYNLYRYNAPWEFGYGTGHDGRYGFGNPLWVGLYGLLFSSGKSVFLYTPLLLGLVTAIRYWWPRRHPEMVVLSLIVLGHLGTVACWWQWSGDWAWSPRLLLPVVPVLFALTFIGAPPGRWLLCLLGALVNGLAILIHPNVFIALTAGYAMAMTQSPEAMDNNFLQHYVPDFSPVCGHAWLVWNKLTGPTAAPWSYLNVPGWNSGPGAYSFDLWWSMGPLSLACIVTLTAGLGACLYALQRQLSRSD